MTRMRRAVIERTTAETSVRVELDLDGRGQAEVVTGIGFYDHLLGSLAHHALIDLTLSAAGDLHVDEHHTVEDVALALGAALDQALGDRTGIERFGDARVPLDESLATCALDLSGRPYAAIDVSFSSDRIGGLPTQLVAHALESFAQAGRLTLHVAAIGRNDHHLAEASFKALARALRGAIAIDPRRTGVASTKGTLAPREPAGAA